MMTAAEMMKEKGANVLPSVPTEEVTIVGKKVSKLTESEGRTLKRMKTVSPVVIPVQVFGRGAHLWVELWQLQTD